MSPRKKAGRAYLNNSQNRKTNCALIPFYNERESLGEVCSRTLAFVDFLILVDDGSDDDYKLPELPSGKFVLLKHEANKGKGAALKTGFRYAIENNFDKVVTLDADLQHLPEKIAEFLDKLETNDIVIGNRMTDIKGMPFQRIASNTITSFLAGVKSGVKINDSQSGYRGYKTSLLNEFTDISNRWGAETEILIKAGKKKAVFGEVNIPVIYNVPGTSKMQPIKAIFQFIRAILKSY